MEQDQSVNSGTALNHDLADGAVAIERAGQVVTSNPGVSPLASEPSSPQVAVPEVASSHPSSGNASDHEKLHTTQNEQSNQAHRNEADSDADDHAQPFSVTSGNEKKRKPRRSKAQRGINAPSGFEEWSADAPVTPAEYARDQALYDPSRTFLDRILIAMQRFELKRRMDSEKRDIYYSYLIFGGIEAGPNMFQGVSQQDMKDMDADEIAAAITRINISSDKDDLGMDTSKWVVDFEGIAKGFFSSRVPARFDLSLPTAATNITNVVSNFLNYLLHHDVCPEYTSQILSAKQICALATTQLQACYHAELWLPGDFNIACSTLFGGDYMGRYDGVAAWAPEDIDTGFIGMKDETARQVVKFGIAGAGTLEQTETFAKMAQSNTIKIRKILGKAFEVTAIIPPDEECRQLYKEHSTNFRPVGKVFAKPWTPPLQPEEDLTPQEKLAAQSTPEKAEPEQQYECFIEQQTQQHLFVGMKVEATIRQLNCAGIMFIDQVVAAYCSFYEILPNELMMDWKEDKPKKIDEFEAGGEAEFAADSVPTGGVEHDESTAVPVAAAAA